MLLCDVKILEGMKKGTILIEPFGRMYLISNSYDVYLGGGLATHKSGILDPKTYNQLDCLE